MYADDSCVDRSADQSSDAEKRGMASAAVDEDLLLRMASAAATATAAEPKDGPRLVSASAAEARDCPGLASAFAAEPQDCPGLASASAAEARDCPGLASALAAEQRDCPGLGHGGLAGCLSAPTPPTRSSLGNHEVTSAVVHDAVDNAAGCFSVQQPLASKSLSGPCAEKLDDQRSSVAGTTEPAFAKPSPGQTAAGAPLSLECGALPHDYHRSAAPLLEAIMTGVHALSAWGGQQPETPEQRQMLLEATMEAVDALADLRWPATAQSAPKRAKTACSSRPQSEKSQAGAVDSMVKEVVKCEAEPSVEDSQDLQLALPLQPHEDREVMQAGEVALACGPEELQVAVPLFPFGGHEIVEDLADWANRSIKERRKAR
eukprot:TRINITY_DN2464_c0_g1_i1.p1 TRINITY_DN2464_c0_g1~~TRINITY_DN2464_c0_g1_i1.p1  ORF type:complete len:425 (-),score=96.81 TRINITY_DN2464_c0_g1_i1:55-1179(-)